MASILQNNWRLRMHNKTAHEPEEFEKRKHKINVPCKAADIGLPSLLLCLEENPTRCSYSLPYGDRFFCKYALHVSIAHGWREAYNHLP